MKKIILILTLLISSCSSEETITFGFEDPETTKSALKIIKEKNIWFKLQSNGRYEFRVSDIPQIQKIYAEVANSIIPFGRSSGHGPEILEIIVKKLKSHKIPYTIKNYQGDNWIIWEDKDHKKVQEVKKEAQKEFSEMLQNKLN